MCLWNTDAPVANKVKLWQKSLSKSYILAPPHPQGHVMSVKCEKPKMNLQSKFGYCMTTQTLNIALCL